MTLCMLPAPPPRDVLDDEEVLTRTYIAERPRRGRERGKRRRVLESLLETRLLLLQLPHRRDPGGPLRTSVEVVVERPVIEEPHEHERTHREPTARDGSTHHPAAALLPRGHP